MINSLLWMAAVKHNSESWLLSTCSTIATVLY